jgi:FMN-dependent NADH-azoreductase
VTVANILLVTSSPRGKASYSNRVAAALAKALLEQHPGSHLVARDLAREPLPHIDSDFVDGQLVAVEARTAAHIRMLKLSDVLIDELMAADIVVIGTALINFMMPSTLKSWVDLLVRAGRTFKYQDGRPVGMAGGKKVYVVEASGSIYSAGELAGANRLELWLRQILGFIGMTDLEFLKMEGIAVSPEVAAAALERALAGIQQLLDGRPSANVKH